MCKIVRQLPLPGVSKLRASGQHQSAQDVPQSLTFSIPKNLSLPSIRKGPALFNIFSKGVCGMDAASFLAGAPPFEGLAAPCYYSLVSKLSSDCAGVKVSLSPRSSISQRTTTSGSGTQARSTLMRQSEPDRPKVVVEMFSDRLQILKRQPRRYPVVDK